MSAPAESSTLLQRVAAGDKPAVREMIDRFGPLVWSMIGTFSLSRADAEDAAQDVFIHVWKKAHMHDARFGTEDQFVAVLARRRLIDRYRTTTTRADKPLDESQLRAIRSDAQHSSGHDAHVARECMSTLIEQDRTVLLLSVVRGLTHDQIARHLSLPLGTVKTCIYRGLSTLRDKLTRSEREIAR